MIASRRCRSDEGVTLIIGVLSLVALLAVGGLALDGGAAYNNRRQSQNAADAAALAGTLKLDALRLGKSTDERSIRDAVVAKLTENDVDVTDFQCRIVTYDASGTGYGPTYPCPTTDLAPGAFDIDNAAGVRVDASRRGETVLMRVVGIDEVTARADARATIQAVRGLEKSSTPFMLCGGSDGVAGSDVFDQPLLTTIAGSYVIDPAAWYTPTYTGPQSGTDLGHPAELNGGPWYLIHDDNGSGADNGTGTGVPGCGIGGNGFKGLVNTNNNYQLPGFWDSRTGQVEGPTESALASGSGCYNGSLNGCYLVVPICSKGQGSGTNGELFCVRFALMWLVQVGGGNGSHYVAAMRPGDTNPFTGQPVPEVVLTGGLGGGRPVDKNEPYIIKLND